MQFIGSELKPITWNSRPGVPWPHNIDPYDTPHRPPDPDDREEGWTDRRPKPPGNRNHLPHVCWLREMNFLIIHVHQYGMDLTDDGVIPPISTDLRIDRLLRPVVQSIMAAMNDSNKKNVSALGRTEADRVAQNTDTPRARRSPDLIQVNSCLWDPARWLRLDLENDRPTMDGLSSERLEWWQRRVRGVSDVLRKAYPDVPIQWVTHHYPINGNLAWFTADIPKSNTSTNQSPRANALVRFVQLRSALEAALRGPPATPTTWCDAKCAREQYESAASVRIGKWGDFMLGMERYMLDALHPEALPGGYLWSDMMLYELYTLESYERDVRVTS